MKIFSVFCLSIFSFVISFAQDNESFNIGADVLKASYQKVAEDTFDRLWEETVKQKIKIPLIDSGLSVDLEFGGGVVPFDELLRIPEVKIKLESGQFPEKCVYVKHVCQIKFQIKGDLKAALNGAIEFPFRMTYMEALSQEEGRNPEKVKSRIFSIFTNYLKMVFKRFDRGFSAIEVSLLPSGFELDFGERFTVERFVLAKIGVGNPEFKMNVSNPVLKIEGKASFRALEISKTFCHMSTTIQNIGHDQFHRLTISKKKIFSLEFLSGEFGFDMKTRKKILGLFRLDLDLNLLRFRQVFDIYEFKHYQFLVDLKKKGVLPEIKKTYLFSLNKFLREPQEHIDYYRSFVIHGHHFTRNMNIFNFYKNSRQEIVENRFIDSQFNQRENVSFGAFKRVKRFFFDLQQVDLQIICDYSYHMSAFKEKENSSGLRLKYKSFFANGLTSTQKWYLLELGKLLDDKVKGTLPDFESLVNAKTNEHYKLSLEIEFDAEAYDLLFEDEKEIKEKIKGSLNERFVLSPDDIDLYKYRKLHLKAMVFKLYRQMIVMKKLMKMQFETSKKRRWISNFQTPGQIPSNHIYFALLAFLLVPDDIHVKLIIEKIPQEVRMFEETAPIQQYRWEYIGKNFSRNFHVLEFYY